jgi:hypothetical protein
MKTLIEISSEYKNKKILILGSYDNKRNRMILENLRDYLREKGFTKASLANDLINIPKNLDCRKTEFITREVDKLLANSDFNIFVLFDLNDSVIGELMTHINSDKFKKKPNHTIIYLPHGYSPTYIVGKLEEKELNTFEYDNEIQLQKDCYVFIKTRLIL